MVTIAAHGSLEVGRFGVALLWGTALHAADELARRVVKVRHVTELEFQGPAIFLGDARGRHELLQSGLNLGLRKDENFGHGDGVEPTFDPAPDSREKGRGADDLDGQISAYKSNKICPSGQLTKIRSNVSG